MQVFIYSNKTMQKDFPEYATHGPLNDSYFADEASHTRLIQSQNNQRKRKSRLSCCVAGSASVFPPCQPRRVRLARLGGSPLRTRLTKPNSSFTFSQELFLLRSLLSSLSLRTRTHEAKTPPRSTKQKASLFSPIKRTLLTKPRSLFARPF